MIKFILATFSILVLFNIIFFAKLTEREDLYNICKVYFKHGQPRFIEINGHEYDLENLSYQEVAFPNPYTREMLENTKVSDCLQIKEN